MASMMANKPDKNPMSPAQPSAGAVRQDVELTPKPRWGWVMRSVIILFMGSQFAGCTVVTGIKNYVDYNTECDNLVIGWRDHIYSRRAFNRRINQMPATQYPESFRDGFIAGYHDVAKGGKGCPPAIPPRRYWSWKYQTAEGQCKVNEWFAGYPYGAKAAEEDGIGNYRDIQISSEVEALLKAEGKTGTACLDCGPQPKSPTPLTYPDGEVIEPGNQVESARQSQRRMTPTDSMDLSVRPASYVLERLPPTQSPLSLPDPSSDLEDE
jgi:hypothetical protein